MAWSVWQLADYGHANSQLRSVAAAGGITQRASYRHFTVYSM